MQARRRRNLADLDLWLLLAAAEYGLGTRDLSFFDERLPWAGGGSASLWEHLRQAHRSQESRRGPHGGYLAGTNGDWSDFSTNFLGMTESTLVTAQLAYVYPRLAELADAARRPQVRRRAALRRGASCAPCSSASGPGAAGTRAATARAGQIGRGVIFGEPQPWALLAGVPERGQARTLVANIRRFLTPSARRADPGRRGSGRRSRRRATTRT